MTETTDVTATDDMGDLARFLAQNASTEATMADGKDDVKELREWAARQFAGYGIKDTTIPENIEKVVAQMEATAPGPMRTELAEKARSKVEIYCLAQGKKWKKSMDEETKAELKARKEEKAELKRPLITQPDGTQVAAPKPPKAEKKAKAAPTEKAPKKSAKPVWQDPEEQAKKIALRPWIKPGSFKADPESEGKTNCVILCQDKLPGCEGEREIHLADSFQVKRCVSCQKKFKGGGKKE